MAGVDEGTGVSELRIGVPENYFWENLAPEVRFAARGAVQVIAALGAKVREVRVPDVAPLMEIARVTLLCEAAVEIGQYSSREQDYGVDVWALIEKGRGFSAVEYLEAQRARQELAREFSRVWVDLDCLVMPTTPNVAFPIEAREDQRSETTRLTRPFNLLGWPALSLPCGFSAEGLPLGVQLAAAPGGEDMLFRAGAAIEGALKLDLRPRR
jgi:aspartyl-tRNA(Asn)/glutamyl-tRNA(Gln) amidotransferase subunit A